MRRHNMDNMYQYQDRKSSASSTAATDSTESNIRSHFSGLSCTVPSQSSDNWSDTTIYDDSLTNLNWLHNVNPVKINQQMSLNSIIDSPSNHVPPRAYIPPVQPQLQSSSTRWLNPPDNHQRGAAKYTMEHEEPDYRNNPNFKPTFSYAILISWAMKDLGKPKVTLSEIYTWIMDHFAYYRHADFSWQNSIRHNLSLGKCFEKVPRRKDEPGKGGFWRISPLHLRALEISLSKVKCNSLHLSLNNNPEKTLPIPTPQSEPGTSVPRNSEPSTMSTKRSRKSPLVVTKEDCIYDEKYSRKYLETTTSGEQNQATFDSSPLEQSTSQSLLFGPSCDNDISMSSFGEYNCEEILCSSDIIEKEDLLEDTEFELLTENNDLCDPFISDKDDLQELDFLLGLF